MTLPRRTPALGLAAILLAGAAFGPRLYRSTLPLTRQIAAQGGEWRDLTISSGARSRAVVHRISRYCFSPGVGVVAQTHAAGSDSLYSLASALAAAAAADVRASDQYVTVLIELDHGKGWPWSSGELYNYAWHRSARDGSWRFITYSPPAVKPAVADSGPPNKRLKLAARVGY